LKPIQEFASRFGLECASDELFPDQLSIQGRNGWVFETKNPNQLIAGVVYLGLWERMRVEFKLSCYHCRPWKPKGPPSDDNCVTVLFDPSNDGQAKLILQLAKLR
jgi:hypothetical protein